MVVLVSNDDGIGARGIRALAEAVADLGEVWVVAPDREQSAASHSLTLHRPLRVEQVAPRRIAVDGTPTDAVYLAIQSLLPERPALVLSGVNHGANMGDDITYSGTVSAAIEGTLLGIPSIAVSMVLGDGAEFATAASFAAALARTVLSRGLPRDTLLNVNVPALPRSAIRGVQITRQGKRQYAGQVEARVDPRGRTYYWIGGEEPGFVRDDGTDFTAVQDGFISVTPLHLDLTDHAAIPLLRSYEVAWP